MKFFDCFSGTWVEKTLPAKTRAPTEPLRTGLTIAADGKMTFSPSPLKKAFADADRAFKAKIKLERTIPGDYNKLDIDFRIGDKVRVAGPESWGKWNGTEGVVVKIEDWPGTNNPLSSFYNQKRISVDCIGPHGRRNPNAGFRPKYLEILF